MRDRPSDEKLADAAEALETRAAELRDAAARDDVDGYSPAGLLRKADWLDEVAAYLDDVRARKL